MTTGSWDRSNYPAGRRINTLTWQGDDRPSLPKRVKSKWKTVYREGAKLRYKLVDFPLADHPPPRVRDAEHHYQKSWNDLYGGDIQTYTNNNGSVYTNAVELDVAQGGSTGFIRPYHAKSDGTIDLNANVDDWIMTSNDDIALYGKLREKISGTDFNASVFLGEGRESLHLIADSATRIYDAYRQLRRGDMVGAAKSLVAGTERTLHRHINSRKAVTENLSTAWLELQYGWRPLLQDTYGAALYVAHKTFAPFQTRFTVRKSVRKQTITTYGGASPLDARYYAKWRSVSRRSITVIVKENPGIGWSLGLMNPEIVAWELVPYSFVVDWFLPIGAYLEARATTSAIVGTYVTTSKHQADYLGCTGHLSHLGGRYNRGIIARDISTSPPKVPLPRFKGIASSLSWQHCANAIALLGGVLPKGQRPQWKVIDPPSR